MQGQQPPDRILAGKYFLREQIGHGGMAVVYRAEVRGAHGFLRTVAVKKMKADLRGGPNYVAMFVEEARVGSELQHPNIVQVFDFCQDQDGLYCLVMEWVDGVDLRGLIDVSRQLKRPIPWPMVAAIGVGCLRGLAAAHERTTNRGLPAPVIHRDISPANILLGANGVVKLADFGLARARDRMHSLTAPGIIKGKLAYIAPEITAGIAASVQSDLFGVGCVLWEALAGHALYEGERDIDVFRKAQKAEIPPIASQRDGLPERLCQIVHTALAPQPEKRFPSARRMAQALATALATASAPGDVQVELAQAVETTKIELKRAPARTVAKSELFELSSADLEPE